MLSYLYVKWYRQLAHPVFSMSLVVHQAREYFVLNINDLEHFLNFMQSLSDMGAVMRRVLAQALVSETHYKSSTGNFCFTIQSLGIKALFFSWKFQQIRGK